MLLLFAITVSIAYPPGAVAQDEGERVRVNEETIGEILRINSTHLALRAEDGRDAVLALAEIGRLERSRGTRSHRWDGALFGTAAGGVAVLISAVDGEGSSVKESLLLVPVGTVVGIIVGARIKSERWEDIPLAGADFALRPFVAGNAKTVRVGVQVRF
jgi:hypothetical protein